MFCSMKLNNRITRLYERAQSIANGDYIEQLIEIDNSPYIQRRHLRALPIKMSPMIYFLFL